MTNSSAFNKLFKQISEARDHAKEVAVAAMKSESIEQLRARWGFIDALNQVLDQATQIRKDSGMEEQ